MSSKLSPEEMLTRARVQLLSKQPFWGTLIMHLTFIQDKDGTVTPTMGVSPYGEVFYNPKYIGQLELGEIKGVLAHEVLHCCLEHLERRGTRTRIKWNIAADYCVNSYVRKEFQLPRGCLYDTKYEDKAVEQIYDMLPDPKYEICNKDCSKCKLKPVTGLPPDGATICKHGIFDRHIEEKERKKGIGKESKQGKQRVSTGEEKTFKDKPKWRNIFIDAYRTAKNIGKTPLGMERLFEIFYPQINWRHILSRYVMSLIPQDFTYSKPHKKSIVSGYYMPAIKKEYLDVVIAIDTSGSIGKDELSEFMSEVTGVLRAFERVRITLMCCDTRVYNVQDITTGYELRKYTPRGGGGTSFVPVFNWIGKHKPNAKILIYLTDAYGTFPKPEQIPSRLKTVWVICKQGDIKRVPKYFDLKVKLG